MARRRHGGLAAAIGAAVQAAAGATRHAAPRPPARAVQGGLRAAVGAIASQVEPRFRHEGPGLYAAAFARNRPYATPGPYQSRLSAPQELAFRRWVASRGVPFDVHAPRVDYDMRGFFKATGGRGWKAGQHFPDTVKTPYDTSFSRESRYASAANPFVWRGDRLVDRKTGRVLFGP